MSEGSFQGVSTMFQESFLKGVSRKIEGSSESNFRVIQQSFKVCKRSSGVFLGSFLRCFKEVSRVKVSRVFQEKFIKSLKGASRILQ